MTPKEIMEMMEIHKKGLVETVLPLYENSKGTEAIEQFKTAKKDIGKFMTKNFESEHFNNNLYGVEKTDVESLISYISNLVAGYDKGDEIVFK